jgi:hypothetical protein
MWWLWCLIGFVVVTFLAARTEVASELGVPLTRFQRTIWKTMQGVFFLAFLVTGSIGLARLLF